MNNLSKSNNLSKAEIIELLKFYPRIGEEVAFYRRMAAQIEDKYCVCSLSVVDVTGLDLRFSGRSDTTGNKALRMDETGDGDLLREIEAEINRLLSLRDAVFEALKSLPGYERQVIWYKYVEGHKWCWIADRVGYSEAQCRRIRDKGICQLIVNSE